MRDINYAIKTAKEEDLLEHLWKCNKYFAPPLNTNIDLDEFGSKIFERAITFEAWDKQYLVGLVSAYFNEFESKIAFVNHVSVLDSYRRQGISSLLLEKCIQYGLDKNFNTILLEVEHKNKIAVGLYKRLGFMVESRNGKKVLMSKKLK